MHLGSLWFLLNEEASKEKPCREELCEPNWLCPKAAGWRFHGRLWDPGCKGSLSQRGFWRGFLQSDIRSSYSAQKEHFFNVGSVASWIGCFSSPHSFIQKCNLSEEETGMPWQPYSLLTSGTLLKGGLIEWQTSINKDQFKPTSIQSFTYLLGRVALLLE